MKASGTGVSLFTPQTSPLTPRLALGRKLGARARRTDPGGSPLGHWKFLSCFTPLSQLVLLQGRSFPCWILDIQLFDSLWSLSLRVRQKDDYDYEHEHRSFHSLSTMPTGTLEIPCWILDIQSFHAAGSKFKHMPW